MSQGLAIVKTRELASLSEVAPPTLRRRGMIPRPHQRHEIICGGRIQAWPALAGVKAPSPHSLDRHINEDSRFRFSLTVRAKLRMPRRISVWPVDPDADAARNRDHRRRKSSRTCCSASHPRHGQRTRQPPPSSISMIPALARCAGGEDVGCGALLEIGAATGVISTGTRAGAASPPSRPLAQLSTSGEQQTMSHPVPACHAADRLAGLQGLFDKADLLVVTPSPPTLGAQHIVLHSR